ncbi:hypothetical protein [Planktothrix tepida]|nr:hypothetical protein [Planktothrix tepida]
MYIKSLHLSLPENIQQFRTQDDQGTINIVHQYPDCGYTCIG